MHFDIIGDIENVEVMAVGGRIRDIMRLRRQFGPGRWRKLKGIARVRLASGNIRRAELHWPKENKDQAVFGLNIMTNQKTKYRFALCIKNDDCEDLEKRKLYQVLPDDDAAKEGYIRIVDESGEDYLYPESYFILVNLPREAQDALLSLR